MIPAMTDFPSACTARPLVAVNPTSWLAIPFTPKEGSSLPIFLGWITLWDSTAELLALLLASPA